MEEIASISRSKAFEILANDLIPYLDNLGFKYAKTKQIFIKNTEFGFLKIAVVGSNYWPLNVEINLVYSIRFNEVENLRSKYIDSRFGNFTKQNYAGWTTIYRRTDLHEQKLELKRERPEMAKYSDIDDGITVTTEQDVKAVSHYFIDSINNTAIPFFSEFSKLSNIANAKKTEFLNDIESWSTPEQCIGIIVLLYCSRDPELPKIVEMLKENMNQYLTLNQDDEFAKGKLTALNNLISDLNL
jgi:hypothetical protein